MSEVAENLAQIQAQIARAANNAGRDPASVQLIAVSKTVEMPRVHEAYKAGQRLFGENKPQELVRKRPDLPEAEWHLIGNLQTNKVKSIIGQAALIHSIDSPKLLLEISKRAVEANVVQNCLVQLNISDEENKGGLDEENAKLLLAHAAELPNVQILGLMGMAAFTDDAVLIRSQFRRLRTAAMQFMAFQGPNIRMQHLSMGMSGDFEIAIEEGATLVRVGSAIFGARSLT
jgi:PLP dependent protein